MELLQELTHGDCSYRVYEASGAPAAFGVFETAVASWNRKRPSDGVPRWRDYDIPDFRGWYGHVRLGRVVRQGAFDVVFEYWGTALGTICGRDMTGSRFSDLLRGDAERAARLELTYLRSVWQHRGIGVAEISLDAYAQSHMRVAFLDLVVGKQSHEPSHLLGYCRIQTRKSARLVEPLPALVAGANRGNVIDLDQARAVRAFRS